MTFKFLIVFLLAASIPVFAQTANKAKIKPKLTYYYIGEGCPFCIDEHPEKEFGFIIKCVGCVAHDTTEKHNQLVALQLDKTYGQNWTFNYMKTYCEKTPATKKEKTNTKQ